MKTKLYDYQQEIVDRIKDRNANALFMDMGTGKTLTSIALQKHSGTSKVLVVCLLSKIDDWVEDINYELDMNVKKVTRKSVENGVFEKNGGVINFEMAWRIPRILDIVNEDWFIIIDESHKIKNPTSKIGRFSSRLSLRTPHKVILTGTPQSQGYIDYYNQLSFIDMIDMTFTRFKHEYCIYKSVGISPVPILVGYKNYKELDKLLEDAVYFKRDIKYPEIPKDIYIDIKKVPAHDVMKRDKVYKDTYVDNSLTVMLRLRQICSGYLTGRSIEDPSKTVKYIFRNYKIDWLRDFLDSTNERVVVYYNFVEEKNNIVEMLEKTKRPYSVYSGDRSSLKEFMENDNGVAVLNYMNGSTGINDLVLASVYVAYSPTTNYIDFVQSRKRIDRIGQDRTPVFYYLRTRGSIEVPIYATIRGGLNFDKEMFDKFMIEEE